MRNSNVTYAPQYKGRPIQASEQLGLGCHGEILDRLEALLDFYIASHSRMFVIRFDVRFPDMGIIDNDEALFQRFLYYFTRHLRSLGLDPAYLWVREQFSSRRDHMHCIFLLNGNRTRHAGSHMLKADELWSDLLGGNGHGLIHHCVAAKCGDDRSGGVMLTRNDPMFEATYDELFAWTSYLAKIATKQGTNGMRRFGSSRLPADACCRHGMGVEP